MRLSAFDAVRETVIVFRKEITELFRDSRTVLVSIGVPLVLFPLLAMILSHGGQSGGIGTPGDVMVSVSGPETAGISGFLRSHDELNVIELPLSGAARKTVRESLLDGVIDVAVVLESPSRVSVVFDNTNHRSLAAGELVTEMLKEYPAHLTISNGTIFRGGASESPRFSVQMEPMHPVAAGAGALILSVLLPVIVLVSAAIGPLASAADLGAGEKERRTLESLFGSPARRSSILAGKFVAVATMGLLGIVSFVTGAGLAYMATRTVIEGVEFTVTGRTVLSVAYTAVLAALTFSGIEFLISLYARSSKAAQTFCVPVLILASAAGYATLLVDMRSLSLWLYHVPLLNLGLIVKGAVLNISHPAGMVTVSMWVVLYIVGAFSLGQRIINRESIFRSV